MTRAHSVGSLAATLLLIVAACAPDQNRAPDADSALIGTWYIRFMVEDAPPGFNLPGLVTVHSDGTFQAVDGGDFGALTDLPFNQTSQHGIWEWLGGNRYLQRGLILSFSREPGSEGQLANILGSLIEIDLDPDQDTFTAVVTQNRWNCPDSFSCPDPLTDPPDETIPAEESGFWIEGRRLE